MKRKLKPEIRIIFRLLLVSLLALIVWGSLWAYRQYDYRFNDAVLKSGSIKVVEGMGLNEVAEELVSNGLIASSSDYLEYADEFERDSVAVGYYKFTKGESYRTLLTRIHFGQESAVRVTFNNIRTLDRLAGALSRNLMIDSLELYDYMQKDAARKGKANYIARFIPNTYEVYWSTSAKEVVERMEREYNKFWDKEGRREKAKKLGYNEDQISTIASIVIEETKAQSEMTKVAGVYLNRLQRGIPLQADPTVKFAMGDFGIKRILNKHLGYQSPYNTYIHAGLPPGPICVPPISAIDATLNYLDHKHSYLYFCASPEFNGLHIFAKSLSEHNRNAAAYHRALNSRKIR